MKILKFSFSSLLQSWGEDARWDNRTTALSPTKSGIIGFLGCCLGYPRGDDRLAELNRNIRIAVRVDRTGEILSDYQTVQGTGGVLLSAEGKKRSGGDTIITPKQYLQNACFTIFLQGESTILEKCYTAMKAPVWTPYLGRKNCVPSIPVLPEWVDAGSLEEAVCRISENERLHCDPVMAVEMDYPADSGLSDMERMYYRKDSILHAERNEYYSRRVKSFTVTSGGGLL